MDFACQQVETGIGRCIFRKSVLEILTVDVAAKFEMLVTLSIYELCYMIILSPTSSNCDHGKIINMLDRYSITVDISISRTILSGQHRC